MDQKLGGLRQGEKSPPMSPPGRLLCPGPAEHPRLSSPQQPPAALCSPKAAPSSALCISWESSDPDLTEAPQLHLLPSVASSLEYGGARGADGQKCTFWSILNLQKDSVCRY